MRSATRLRGLLVAIGLAALSLTAGPRIAEGGETSRAAVLDLRESSDGRHLIVLADDALHAVSLANGRTVAVHALPSGHRLLLPLEGAGQTLLLGERPGVHDASTGRVSGLSLPRMRELAQGGDLVVMSDGGSMIHALDRKGEWLGAMPMATETDGGIRQLAVARDGRRVAVFERGGRLHLVDFPARLDLATVSVDAAPPVVAAGFVGDGRELALVRADGTIELRDGHDGHETRVFASSRPMVVVDAAIGAETIGLVGSDGAIVLRRLSDGGEPWSFPPTSYVRRLRVSNDGGNFFAFGEGPIAIIDARTGAARHIPALTVSPSPPSDPDGKATPTSPGRLHVMAIGIDRYARADRRLAHAVADARAVIDLFESRAAARYTAVETTLLEDGAVTDAALEDLFGRLSSRMTARDALVVFIAGHGRLLDDGFHLVPAGVDPEDDEEVRASGIRRARWDWWLSRLPIARGLMLVDTCESGRAGRRNLLTRRAALSLDRQGGFSPMPGLSIVTSTSDYGQALDSVDGHGAVVTALMAAANGADADADGDGAIDAGELARFLARAVPETTQRSHGWRQELRVSLDRAAWKILKSPRRAEPK